MFPVFRQHLLFEVFHLLWVNLEWLGLRYSSWSMEVWQWVGNEERSTLCVQHTQITSLVIPSQRTALTIWVLLIWWLVIGYNCFMALVSRNGVKYIELFLNTNTFILVKYFGKYFKYKYFSTEKKIFPLLFTLINTLHHIKVSTTRHINLCVLLSIPQ